MTIKVRITEGDEVRHICEYEPTAKNAIIGYFVSTDMNGNDIYSDDKILVYDIARYGICEPHVEIAGDIVKVSDIGKEFDDFELVGD